MSETKELKSIDLSSYTIMSTGINVLIAIVFSVILAIGIGLGVRNGFSIAIYIISLFVVGTLMYKIYESFLQGFLYNLLCKKMKNIEFEFDGGQLTKISTMETAIMASIIATIEVILMYLVSMLIVPLMISVLINTFMYSGQLGLASILYNFLLLINQPIVILLSILSIFVATLVSVFLATFIYNLLAKQGRGIDLTMSEEGEFTVIDSVNPITLAIALSIVAGILNLISTVGIILIGGNLIGIFGTLISGFVSGFISGLLIAVFYNFLAPRLGKLKLELIEK